MLCIVVGPTAAFNLKVASVAPLKLPAPSLNLPHQPSLPLDRRAQRVVVAGFERVRQRRRCPRSTLPEAKYDEHDPRTDRYAARPGGDGALLLHFRLDVAELQYGLVVRVAWRSNDDPEAYHDQD